MAPGSPGPRQSMGWQERQSGLALTSVPSGSAAACALAASGEAAAARVAGAGS